MARARAVGARGHRARRPWRCAGAGARLPRPARPGVVLVLAGAAARERGALRGDDRGGLLGQRPLRAAGDRDGGGARRRGRGSGCVGAAVGRRGAGRGARARRRLAAAVLSSRARPRAGHASGGGTLGGARVDRALAAPPGARASGGPRWAPDYISLFGPATVNRSYQTHMAWELSMPIERHPRARGPRDRLHRSAAAGGGPDPDRPAGAAAGRRSRGWASGRSRSGPPRARHVYTWPVQGFSLRAAAARYGYRPL